MRKICELGRSMVEMLGVLAIIGVLSVGGITGYSKAMMKYKLNKHAQQLSQLLNTLYRYKNSWGENPPPMELGGYFITMGEIPEEMIIDGSNVLQDSFDNRIHMQTNGCSNNGCTDVILRYTVGENNDIELCQNIFTVAKSFHQNLYVAGAYKTTQDNSIEQYDNDRFYGDKYCDGKNCLRNLTLDDIYNKCQYLADRVSGSYYFLFNLND
ncbi:MAG: type II secretion system protein [Alphaproteobacteria bacterium]|nr:type II secretion system protein [Alphaproteobacteria bacterium]